jgi:hypothetical protein
VIKVGVVGAKGRMGQAVVEAVKDADDMHLVAAVDIGVPPTALREAGSDVIVDFTTPDAVMRTLKASIASGIHCVVGTTGFTPERLRTRPSSSPLPGPVCRRARMPPHMRWTAPAAPPSTASTCIQCDCAASSPTRRSCSAGSVRR